MKNVYQVTVSKRTLSSGFETGDVLKNQQGQALIQVVIASAVMGIVMMSMVSMQTMQNREIKAMAEKMASLDLARVVSLSLTKSCNELIDNSNLVGPPDTLTFDATTVTPANPYVINLKKIPAADLSLGEKASPLSPSVVVQQTDGIQISVTGPSTANLLVKFDKSLLVRSIRDLSFPLYLGSTGPPNSTTITGCQSTEGGGGGGGIASCPPGWTMIGDSGKHATYCIETNERPATTWYSASNTCLAINDASLGRAHLCDLNEWRTACKLGGPSNMTNNSEWAGFWPNGKIPQGIFGFSGCDFDILMDSSLPLTFRCCIR